jgi:membrane associated rhomboid family serine protease/DNA-directed RNA polymerase subunit RPC12/RpoP
LIPSFAPLSWLALAIMVTAVSVALSRRFLATGALLLGNIAVFLLQFIDGTVQNDLALHATELAAGSATGYIQLFSSMFVHMDLWHILLNMIFLWAFGAPFEERIGHRRFILVYLVAGLVGTFAQVAASYDGGQLILLGASGAIFGIMCAFATKYPNQVIGVPVPVFIILIRIPMRVLYGAMLWLGLEIAITVGRQGAPDGVGHFAHLFGGVAGILLALTVLRKVTPRAKAGPIAINLAALTDFARDPPTREVLAHMRQNHDEPDVFQAWLDRFFRTATCPTCSQRVMPKHRGEVVCTQGHSFDVRQAPTQKPLT